MNHRVLLFLCLIFLISLSIAPSLFAADEEDEDDEEEDPWGESKIDHELNAGWDYPSDYIAQPLNYSKRVTEFGITFSQKSSRHFYDDNSELVEGSFRTKKQNFDLFFGMGFSDNLSIALTFPFVYKKTKILEGNQNYRMKRDNTYGYLVEEAFVDFFDNHELWKLWEADLPQLGDIRLYTCYSVYRKLEPRTTSVVVELDVKFPTGNDNPRRTGEIRNYIADGNTDSYIGAAVKQQVWKFSFEAHAGYNIRWKGDTKYSPGTIDYADQILASGEIMFQVPDAPPLWETLALGTEVHYMARPDIDGLRFAGRKPFTTYVKDNSGNELEVEDSPGSLLSVGPKVIYQAPIGWITHLFDEVNFGMDIPVMGQNSLLVKSRSESLPPYEVESYEGIGVTYSIGVLKRWQ